MSRGSVAAACRRHGIDPQRYLTQLLTNLPDTPISQLPTRLPDACEQANPDAAPKITGV